LIALLSNDELTGVDGPRERLIEVVFNKGLS